jgi:cob(I)alamin adenosyltransferase
METEKQEEITNIRNGLNYAKKVLTVGECDILILDEVLGLIDEGIIAPQEMRELLEARSEETSVFITGIVLPEELVSCVDFISKIWYDKREVCPRRERNGTENTAV